MSAAPQFTREEKIAAIVDAIADIRSLWDRYVEDRPSQIVQRRLTILRVILADYEALQK